MLVGVTTPAGCDPRGGGGGNPDGEGRAHQHVAALVEDKTRRDKVRMEHEGAAPVSWQLQLGLLHALRKGS